MRRGESVAARLERPDISKEGRINENTRQRDGFFRSIDSESVEGFPMNIRGAEEQNLEWTRNVAIDKSINMAHIQTIRPAEHFIYIENKYFIEHVATIEDWFENIENMVCLSYVNRMAEDNWKRYTNKPFTPLQGHILKYPAHWRIDVDGNVKPMLGHDVANQLLKVHHEPWLICLVSFHVLLLLVAFLSRKNINFQMCLFLLALGGVYFAERLNQFLAGNWRSFAGQNYFDANGLFLSVLWSGPLLVIAIVILVNTLFSLCYLIVRWKRAELKHRARIARSKEE
ncbi:Unknown protein [Striga hermonthica]|uniref:Phospholipase D C-terminal domain-containing protein n=1 Tax=Striga hermonthica TaxID=68872 RepID=A0A9N7MX59_STRHE|nr:Unknown protein [Striga hermonthica]